MNSQAFTLFTALVSFVLIALGFVLVQSMIESERSSSQTIETIDEQTEMQNIADLARADALQVFNIGVRYQFELWITSPTNEFYILDRASASDWEKMIDDFAKAELGSAEVTVGEVTKPASEQLANRMTQHLISSLSTGGNLQAYNFKGYDVSLQINEDPNHPFDASAFTDAMKTIINESVASQTLLEPIECTDSSCNIGTFYINLDLTKLTFEKYNQLPQIVVKSYASGRIIKQPILPKGNIRVYVPLRIFKAMWKSKEIAKNHIFGSSGFSSRIQDYGLGMCDTGCTVRVSPKGANVPISKQSDNYFPPSEGRGKLCPNTPSDPDGQSLAEILCDPQDSDNSKLECPDVGKYFANKTDDMGNTLRKFISQQAQEGDIELKTSELDVWNDGLLLWNGEDAPAGSVINGQVQTVETKKVISCYNGKSQCAQTEGKAYCVRTSGLEVTLEFVETKDEFKVNQARSDNTYKIRIVDNYQSESQSQETCYSITATSTDVLGNLSSTYSCES